MTDHLNASLTPPPFGEEGGTQQKLDDSDVQSSLRPSKPQPFIRYYIVYSQTHLGTSPF